MLLSSPGIKISLECARMFALQWGMKDVLLQVNLRPAGTQLKLLPLLELSAPGADDVGWKLARKGAGSWPLPLPSHCFLRRSFGAISTKMVVMKCTE